MVREKSWKMKKVGKLKSVSSYSQTTTDTGTDNRVIYCVILHLLQPQCIKCRILKAQWLPGLLSINVKNRLLTIMLNSISMNLCLPYWKVWESYVVWEVATLDNGHLHFLYKLIVNCQLQRQPVLFTLIMLPSAVNEGWEISYRSVHCEATVFIP